VGKTFTHPLRLDLLAPLISGDARILEFGCGYGRLVRELTDAGYPQVIGVDIAPALIAKGRELHPDLDLRLLDTDRLPFADGAFAACLLFAVLNCIPGDAGQRALIAELHRVLGPGGILYLSDYPLQRDQRNRDRYAQYQERYGRYGVFETTDGGVMRHHDRAWLDTLLHDFELLQELPFEVRTMNGNPAAALQLLLRKR